MICQALHDRERRLAGFLPTTRGRGTGSGSTKSGRRELLLTMADRNSDDEVYSDGSCRVHVEQRREVREGMWRLHLEHPIKALDMALRRLAGEATVDDG